MTDHLAPRRGLGLFAVAALAAATALAAGLFFLLDETETDVAGLDGGGPEGGTSLVTYSRTSCGNAFTSGYEEGESLMGSADLFRDLGLDTAHLPEEADPAAECADAKRGKRIAGYTLGGSGVLGLAASGALLLRSRRAPGEDGDDAR
ncbi:hypothetical protein [Streptomyces hoynatensis]|uniref:Uncharacterized protein n=1 Tax=Streptomyces hoynatensis TaxID=1141874 RepID=A0A3A9YRG2_9ACTN|nr:hypothetical protein [Streptomyces hoynatensis]RKN38525.1 hypothetical protein D7294_23930 [Streptomyces hoynatensis]